MQNQVVKSPKWAEKNAPLSFGHYKLICALALLCIALAGLLKNENFLPEGPSLNMALSTAELLSTGSLYSERLDKIHFHLLDRSKKESVGIWQDIYVLTNEGQVFPKHVPLLTVLALPFYAVFGRLGFLIFNLLGCWIIFWSIGKIAQTYFRNISFAWLAFCSLAGTQLISNVFTFSYDVIGTAFILGGLALTLTQPGFGCFLLGLSTFFRPTNAMLCFLLATCMLPLHRRTFFRAVLGFSLGISLFLLYNTWLFGMPWITAHHRMPSYVNGIIMITAGPTEFNLAGVFDDFYRKLFDSEVGLLRWNPILFFLPSLLVLFHKNICGRYILGTSLVWLGFSLFTFGYNGWAVSTYGNRYLLAATLVMVPMLAAASQTLIKSLWNSKISSSRLDLATSDDK